MELEASEEDLCFMELVMSAYTDMSENKIATAR
jgi:hypothetical protein